jgi:hypothetical protein
VNQSPLTEVLERVTADLPVRDRGPAALRQARVVHRRRRTGVVAGLVAAAATTLVVPQTPLGPDRDPSPAPSPTLLPTPTVTGPVDGPTLNAEDYPVWDPFTLAESDRGTSVLPEVLEPPDEAPSVFDQPLDAAVIAWPEEGRDLMLLGVDGSWRSVPGTADAVSGTLRDVVRPALTSDGHRVAMSTTDGILVVDVTEGTQQVLPWPAEIPQPTDTVPPLEWLPGNEQLNVDYYNKQWIVGLDGADREAPWSADPGYQVAVDQAGQVRQYRYDQHDLITWQGDEIVSDADVVWWGERYVAGYGMVAFTGNLADGSHGGPAVVTGDTAEVIAWARTPDRASVYSDNGYLTAQGFLDPHTLLVLVAPMDFRTMQPGTETWYLATWDLGTGGFEHLTTGDTRMRDIAVAIDVVR